jgi:hypothetical protein
MIEEIERRLAYLDVSPHCVDRDLVERMWGKLDCALQHRRLEVWDAPTAWGTLRVVAALGLLQFEADVAACELTAYAIQEDESRRRIDSGFRGPRIFDSFWWMRYAFQRWAPECSGVDFVVDPLNRPSRAELDATCILLRRLKVDPRYWTLLDEFNAAIGTPALISEVMIETDGRLWQTLQGVSEIWRLAETRRYRADRPSA